MQQYLETALGNVLECSFGLEFLLLGTPLTLTFALDLRNPWLVSIEKNTRNSIT